VPGALTPLRRPDRHGLSIVFCEIKSDFLATISPCRAATFSNFDRESTRLPFCSIIWAISKYYQHFFAPVGNFDEVAIAFTIL